MHPDSDATYTSCLFVRGECRQRWSAVSAQCAVMGDNHTYRFILRRSPPPPRDRNAFASRESGLQPTALVSASRASTPIRRSVEAPAVSAPERLEDAEMLHTQHNLPSIAETAAEVQHAQHGAMNQPGLSGLSEGGLRGLTTVRLQYNAPIAATAFPLIRPCAPSSNIHFYTIIVCLSAETCSELYQAI